MAGGGSIAGLDLQSCWVNLLSSRIPVLVVAVDDALLTGADRVLHHWKKSGAPLPAHLHTYTHLTSAGCCDWSAA